MQYAVQAIPFLVLAVMIGLVVASRSGGRIRWQLPVRAPRPKKSTLRSVPRSRMDDELQDLIRRR